MELERSDYAKAFEFYENCNFEEAYKYFQKSFLQACDQNGNCIDSQLLDGFADTCLALGDVSKAKQLYLKSIEVNPNINASKYFTLAQLDSGYASLQLYQKGIEILSSQNGINQNEESQLDMLEQSQIKMEISKAMAAQAELFMTDLCDEQDAENQCSNLLQNAIQYSPECPDAWQGLANLHLIRDRAQEAKECMQKVIQNLQFDSEIQLSSKHLQSQTSSFLQVTVNLLQSLEMWQESIKILKKLIEQDEWNIET